MSSLPLIGLKGRRKAGKDTVAKILMEQFGYQRKAFADNLKREIYEAFGHSVLEELWWQEQLPPGPSYEDAVSWGAWMSFIEQHKNDGLDSELSWVGPLLQWWGTEYRRKLYGDNYWIEQLRPELGPGIVVTDIRFPNEAALIKELGGFIVHVERPDLQDDGGARGSSHSSESQVDHIAADATIINDRLVALPIGVHLMVSRLQGVHLFKEGGPTCNF